MNPQSRWMLGILLILAPDAMAATPVVSAIYNNASYIPSGAPASGIAQGSIFVVFGTDLGPSTPTQQSSYPLQKTLGGTSLQVTVSGTTVDAIPIYVSPTQVSAILPSATPVGEGTVTVSYNGGASASKALTVVDKAFGIFTWNSRGSGRAVLTRTDGSLFTTAKPAIPGDVFTLWGTGLGAIGGDDAAVPAVQDRTDIPVELYVGGKAATISYRGRSGCCAGLDQINAKVPTGTGDGCYVSVAVKIGTVVGNVASLPVASKGGTCSDAFGLTAAEWDTLSAKNGSVVAWVRAARSFWQSHSVIGPPSLEIDDPVGEFAWFDTEQLNGSQVPFQQPSAGSCTVHYWKADVMDPVNPSQLDAGAAITMAVSSGITTLGRNGYGYYSNISGTASQMEGSTFTFTGSGGTDIGPFEVSTAMVTVPSWTGIWDAPPTITRSVGWTVSWTGGDADGYVEVDGSSGYTTFACIAAASAGTLRVPPEILYTLGDSMNVSYGAYSRPVRFAARFVDVGLAQTSSSYTNLWAIFK